MTKELNSAFRKNDDPGQYDVSIKYFKRYVKREVHDNCDQMRRQIFKMQRKVQLVMLGKGKVFLSSKLIHVVNKNPRE